jgi:hypothetical protein
MASAISPELRTRIAAATADVAAAQAEVERALAEVTTGARADKKIISEVLKLAFERLAAARSELAAVIGGQ